jgi:hypothetical protein
MMRSSSRIVAGASGGVLLVLLASCSDGPPVLRSRADADISAPTNSNDPVAAQCQQLRDQVRGNQESQREAVTISTNPQIVAAAEGKADQRIDQLHNRMDSLGCADQAQQDSSSTATRIAPMPPAPNAPNP